MLISAIKETGLETRVGITPASAKQLIKLGFEVNIEASAGVLAGFKDEAYEEVGANVLTNKKVLLQETQILLCVNEPDLADVQHLPKSTLIIGSIENNPEKAFFELCLTKQLRVFSMDNIPRISRAQSMDSLSSQANLAGYKAVLEGANHFHRALPMMMTAAGMIHPAKVLILGAGVAGLQAIATAKRLGAIVYAFDVRRAAKEQVESLGAEFIEVPVEEDGQSSSGYATESSEAYKKAQEQLIQQYAKQSDIVISTALIPNRKAPVLIQKETVESMKPGSVIVDMATSKGGNCAVSVCDKTIQVNAITIIGTSNLARLVPTTASELYATNLVNVIKLLNTAPNTISLNPNDEIIIQSLLCEQGQYQPLQSAKENT
jgi:NAD(P) transhydrogenase subunit alpha